LKQSTHFFRKAVWIVRYSYRRRQVLTQSLNAGRCGYDREAPRGGVHYLDLDTPTPSHGRYEYVHMFVEIAKVVYRANSFDSTNPVIRKILTPATGDT